MLRAVVLASCLLLALANGAPAAQNQPTEWIQGLRTGTLNPAAGVTVLGVEMPLGGAKLWLERGVVLPVHDASGTPLPELVFVGRGRLEVTPPDDVEAGQLELFAGTRVLEEEVTAAVLALGNSASLAALLAGEKAQVPADAREEAAQLFTTWRESAERRIAGVEFGLLRAHGLAEPKFSAYLAAFLATKNHEELVWVFDPEALEQATLGQFVEPDLTERERRQVERAFHREQRRGRFIGLELGEIGNFDTWLSASARSGDASPRPGATAFEPTHYTIDAAVARDGENLAVAGRCTVDLVAGEAGARSVLFQKHLESQIRAVRGAAGEALSFVQREGEILVALPAPVEAGGRLRLELEFSGPPFEALGKYDNMRQVVVRRSWLGDPLGWYPHTGTIDRATYDVTLRPPRGETVVALGREVAQGPGWTRHVLEQPTVGFSFEIGDYEHFATERNDVSIELHLDRFARIVHRVEGEELLDSAARAVAFLVETFGRPPTNKIVLVTGPRSYSQSLLGQVSLSAEMVAPGGWRLTNQHDLVLVHELAHQWWGHQAGFHSYRDQWLSEAMANYAVALALRTVIPSAVQRRVFGDLASSRETLVAPMADGRPLENAGPLILGARLGSSRADAYVPIVYRKGGLVLDLLSRFLGEEEFHRALRQLLAESAGGPLSTEAFLAGIERLTGKDVTPLANAFIYGIGLPEVVYDARFEADPAGGWWVRSTVRQRSLHRYRFRAVALGGGRYDVVREAVPLLTINARTLVAVPLQIGVYDPTVPWPESDLHPFTRAVLSDAAERGNARIEGRAVLRGPETRLRLRVDLEPRSLRLDPHLEIPATFLDAQRAPKRAQTSDGLALVREGRLDEAAAAFRRALEAPAGEVDVEPIVIYGAVERRALRRVDAEARQRRMGRLFDILLHHELARIALAKGELDAAEDAIDDGERIVVALTPGWVPNERRVLRARIALAEGKPRRALELLEKDWLRDEADSREALALAAVAAWQLGDKARFAELEKETKGREIDLSVLTVGGPP